MKTTPIISLLLSTLLVTTSSCGGGGGGGGTSKSSRPSTGIRVFNGCLDCLPVDVLIAESPESAIPPSTSFAEASNYTALSSNRDYTVNLARAQFNTELIKSSSINLEKNEVKSLILAGDNIASGVRISQITDPTLPELASSEFAVRIIHAVNNSSKVTASLDGTLIGENLSFASGSNYTVFPAGATAPLFRARRVADGSIVSQQNLSFAGGKHYTIFLTGEADYFVTTKVIED